MIQATPRIPTAARMIEIGTAIPAPLPVNEAPAMVEMKKADANTGPMKPIDWAMTSIKERQLPLAQGLVRRIRPHIAPPLSGGSTIGPPPVDSRSGVAVGSPYRTIVRDGRIGNGEEARMEAGARVHDARVRVGRCRRHPRAPGRAAARAAAVRAATNEFYRARWDAAGVDIERVDSLEALAAIVPMVSKSDFVDDQLAHRRSASVWHVPSVWRAPRDLHDQRHQRPGRRDPRADRRELDAWSR